MPSEPLPDDARAMLAKANPCTVTTLRRDGTPVSVATWYLLDGDRVLLNMDAERVRVKHLRHDPRLSLTVLDSDDWYTHLSIIGRVIEWREDPDLVDIDRLSQHYTGREYPVRDRPRVSVLVEIDRWHGWGAMKD